SQSHALHDALPSYSAALDAYIEMIVCALHFRSIFIDLTETEIIDSTSLGLLAKLSILSTERVGLLPTLVSPREDMLRLLQSMGFEQIFNIVPESTPTDAELQELPPQTLSEEQVRSRVLEAQDRTSV